MIVFDLSYIKSSVLFHLTHKGDVWFVYGPNPWKNIIPSELSSGAYILPSDKSHAHITLHRRSTSNMSYHHDDDITITLSSGTFVYLGGNIHTAYTVSYSILE